MSCFEHKQNFPVVKNLHEIFPKQQNAKVSKHVYILNLSICLKKLNKYANESHFHLLTLAMATNNHNSWTKPQTGSSHSSLSLLNNLIA